MSSCDFPESKFLCIVPSSLHFPHAERVVDSNLIAFKLGEGGALTLPAGINLVLNFPPSPASTD